MKTFKLRSLLSLTLLSALLFASCADLAVENTNEPTKEAVEGSAENQSKLLAGGFYDLTTAIVSSRGVNIQMLADQNTSTNNYNRYWDFADEPRLRLNNTSSYSNTAVFSTFYGGFNSSISTANIFINNIVNNGIVITNSTGADVTNSILAQAYFLRGWARGMLSLMYDQAFLIDENFVIGEDTPEFVSYTAMNAASLSDLDEALSLAAASTIFNFNAMPNPVDSWDADEFQDIVNSVAAKMLAGKARTATESQANDWNAILAYAEAGIGGPDAKSSLGVFKNANIGSAGEFANYLADWSNFVVAGSFNTGAGYNPTDIKQLHLLDPDYPVVYPADSAQGGTAALYPASSTDPRITYFKYTRNAGFLNSTRNPNLYTNYFSARFFAESDWWPAEYEVIFFTDTENDLLIAEAQVMTNQRPLAATTLNNSAAGTGTTTVGFSFPSVELGYVDSDSISLSGGNVMLPTATVLEFQFALLREISVEIHHMGGTSSPWFLMRRHDMLQAGTATMLPVPGGELEILGLDNYTFGGANFAGDVGTASGVNTWTTLANRAGLNKRVKAGKLYYPRMDSDVNSDRNKPNLSSKGIGNN